MQKFYQHYKEIFKIVFGAVFGMLTLVICYLQDITSLYYPQYKLWTFLILIIMIIGCVRLSKTIDEAVKNIHMNKKKNKFLA